MSTSAVLNGHDAYEQERLRITSEKEQAVTELPGRLVELYLQSPAITEIRRSLQLNRGTIGNKHYTYLSHEQMGPSIMAEVVRSMRDLNWHLEFLDTGWCAIRPLSPGDDDVALAGPAAVEPRSLATVQALPASPMPVRWWWPF